LRRLLILLAAAPLGCSGFAVPTPEVLRELRIAPPPSHPAARRFRVRMSVDSPWLAGEFEGVVVVREGASPEARAQFFGDVGPKSLDLLARPDRIVGFFPQAQEGVDCRLPAEAAPHPLLFLGASLLEEVADLDEGRILGVRADREGWWLNLKPVVPGMRSEALRSADGRILERRLRWMYGLSWEQRWERADECVVRAPRLAIRVKILESEPLPAAPARAFDLAVPEDVRIVEGSRK
jgi:hypothetical protein